MRKLWEVVLLLLCSQPVAAQMTWKAMAETLKVAWTRADDPPTTVACLYGDASFKDLDSLKITTGCTTTFGGIYFTHQKFPEDAAAEEAMLCFLLKVKHPDMSFLGEMYGIGPNRSGMRDSLGNLIRVPLLWACWKSDNAPHDSTKDTTHASPK